MKTTKACILIKTKDGNHYLYDRVLKRFHLLHPVLFHILSQVNTGSNVEAWMEGIKNDPVELPPYGNFSRSLVMHFYRKYLLLKASGYMGEIDQEDEFDSTLSAETIRYSLANVKQITFEVTDRCNLKCKYCGYGDFYEDYDRRENKNLDIRSAKNLLDYFAEIWNSPWNISHRRNIYISFYGGEPLLNFPFIKEIIEYLKQKKFVHNHFTFSMTTNGMLLNKLIDYLAENNVKLLISLDGDEENNVYRVDLNGNPVYSKIIRNIEDLKDTYPGYFKDHVNFNAVLQNKNSVEGVYHFFKERFNKIPSINSLNTSGIKESRKQEFWETYSNVSDSLHDSEDYSMIEKDMFIKLPTLQGVSILLHQLNEFAFSDYRELLVPGVAPKRIPTGTCVPFSKKVFVTVNGKILPCERIGQQFYFGNVSPDGIELDEEEAAEKYNNSIDKLRKQCNRCYNHKTCVQCVFNLENFNNNPVCKGFMNYSQFSGHLAAHIDYLEQNRDMYMKIMKEVVVE